MTPTLLALLLALSGPLVFRTGPPELSKAAGTVVPMTEQEYARVSERMRANPRSVTVSRKAAGVTDHALYGYNFVIGGKNRGWILDGDEERGWRLYLDWKGDGDLSAVQPLSFERVDGRWRLQVDVADGDVRWPCRFEVSSVDIDGKQKLAVLIAEDTVRRGVIEIEGKRAPFVLRGTRGVYGDPDYGAIAVDRGTGEQEAYKISERYLNLFGKSYGFAVDQRGDSLTLTELAELRPDRPSLKVGSAAPEFSANDIDGEPQSIAKYRGRMLLVEFWSTSCGPCRAEAPQMVRFFKEVARGKVAFLGISSDEAEKDLRAFLHDNGIAWPQIRELDGGPAHKLYRVNGEPTYFLIGESGAILDAWVGSELAVQRVSKFLQKQ